jgi:hypothetical protein
MPLIADAALDAALAVVADSDALYICNAEPTTFTQATSTFALGTKATPTIGAAADRSPTGRRRTVAAITDGTVTASGTATHWALTKASGSLLRATGPLTTSQVVTSGNPFTLGAFDVGIADAT